MNNDAKTGGAPSENGVIAAQVDALLSGLDQHVGNEAFRDRLRSSLKQLADVKFALDESSIVAVTDAKGRIQYVNDKFCEISKYGRDELIGKDHRIVNSGHHGKSFMKELWSTISAGRVWSGEIKNRAKDGSLYWMNTTIVPFVGDNGRPYQYLAIRSEVTRLKKAEEELQESLEKMMTIQEDERKRFSRELHDGIGQSLFSLLIQLDSVIANPGRAAEDLRTVRENVAGIIEEVRGLAWELRPSVLDDMGIVPAIRTYIGNYEKHYGIEVGFVSALRSRLGIKTETVMYRIIQEALTNIAKYADVSEAQVSIEEDENAVTTRISDLGAGFDPEAASSGVGRFGMAERARIAGGSLEVASAPGRGTTVTLIVPHSRKNEIV